MRFVATVSACLFALVMPGGATAERGALTMEASTGAGLGSVTIPYAESTEAGALVPFLPYASLTVRYSLTHDVSVGVAGGVLLSRTVAHHDVHVSDDDGPLLGTLVHSVGGAWIQALTRLYVTGYDWRTFIEPAVGWKRTTHRDLDHRRVGEEGIDSYEMDLLPFASNQLGAGLALGLEHVWDRVGLGVRCFGAAVLGGEAGWEGGLMLHAAYDFYP